MSNIPHIPHLTRRDLELYAHLGADENLAHRLAQRGLAPDIILCLDHPNSEMYAPTSADTLDDAEYEAAIITNFPPFDPTVLEHASTRPWTSADLMEGHMHLPGPLNRYMTMRDAGIYLPALLGVPGFDRPDTDMLADLAAQVTDTMIHIREDDIAITLSLNGATVNEATEAEQIAVALGGKRSPAMTILHAWNAATRDSWPERLNLRALDAALPHVDCDGREPDDAFHAIDQLCESISRRRYLAIESSLPTWHEAFTAEHPDL